MSMQDPMADMLARIRNAQLARHQSLTMPSSTVKVAICEVLKGEGYIASYAVAGASQAELPVELKYYNGRPAAVEAEETFTLVLSGPTNGTIATGSSTATARIADSLSLVPMGF